MGTYKIFVKICFFGPGLGWGQVCSLVSQIQMGYESPLRCCELTHSLGPLCHSSLAFLWPCLFPEGQRVQEHG